MTTLSKTILFVLFVLLLGACKSEPAFKTVTVDFFLEHPTLSVEPATFETVTEQVLVKDASLAGATFETITEQVLVRESYRDLKITDIQYINLLVDHEESRFCAVPCITYYEEEAIFPFQAPAEYSIRTYEKVLVNGTGEEKPAEYSTRQLFRTVTNASLRTTPTRTLEPLRKVFRIPVEMDFDTFWQEALMNQGMDGCGEGVSYEVVEE